ncbi:MAG: ABC transporter substrate-binding protein [SAR202 cluster bacterium]|nr:ABC transporter substrate-binding protein [SAR202 cluster bacterium]
MPATGALRRLPALLIATALALLVAGCSGDNSPSPTPAPTVDHSLLHGREAVVGVVLSLTGSNAIYGEPQRKGIALAMDEINQGLAGYPHFILDIRDDEGDPQKAKAIYEEMVARERLLAIVGPTLSASAVVADPVAQAAGVPVLAVSNTATGVVEIGDYVFRNSLSEAQVIPQTVAVAKSKLGLQRVAIIYGDGETFTLSGYHAFKDALAANGISIAAEQSYAPGRTDFADLLREIGASHPDAIVASSLARDASVILQQARALGITAPFIGGNGFNSPSVLSAAGEAADGLMVGAAWNVEAPSDLSRKFVEAYRTRYGQDPDQFAAQAYAGLYILGKAISRIGPEEGRSELRETLQGVSLETVLGDFRFAPSRDAQHPAVVQIVRGGRFVPYQ